MTDTSATSDSEPGVQDPVERIRLQRSTRRHLVGGVAGGLGERFDVDPNIIRVIFVVLSALWGFGVAVYLAMWALIPSGRVESDDDIVARVENSRWSRRWLYVGLVGLGLVMVLSLLSFAGVRPQWGESLAVTWLVFLVVVFVMMVRARTSRISLGRLLAYGVVMVMTVLVVAIGVLLGFVASTGVPMTGRSGSQTWQPEVLAQVQHRYSTDIGVAVVDLTAVSFPSSGYTVRVTVALGHIRVDAPPNAVVYLKTQAGIGVVRYAWTSTTPSGSFVSVPSSDRSRASQLAAPHLTIDADVGIGSIAINR